MLPVVLPSPALIGACRAISAAGYRGEEDRHTPIHA